MPLDVAVGGGAVSHAAGGTAGNTAAILAFWGWRVHAVGRVGDDRAGRAIREDLSAAGVDVTLLRVASRHSPRVVCEAGPDGEPAYSHKCPACGSSLGRSIPLLVSDAEHAADVLQGVSVVFSDRANPGSVLLARRCAQAGATVMFEPHITPNGPQARSMLDVADIVKVSSRESDSAPPRPMQMQIATMGAAGARWRVAAGCWHHQDAPPRSALSDCSGAGDWGTACLLDALEDLQDPRRGIEAALAWAQRVASLSCLFAGARGLARGRSPQEVAAMAVAGHVGSTPVQPPRTVASGGGCSVCLSG